MRIYLAVGHGRTPSGAYDPGAGRPPFVEHELAHKVVDAFARQLIASGYYEKVFLEQDGGSGHDPNFTGSAWQAKALRVDAADEIHFNASGDHKGHGVEVWIHPNSSGLNRWTAGQMCTFIASATGLRNRRVKDGSLGWLRGTYPIPSTLIEVAFVDNSIDQIIISRDGFSHQVGAALAEARIQYARQLGAQPAPPETPIIIRSPVRHEEDKMNSIAISIAALDDQGNGWFELEGIPAEKIVSVISNGSYPPVDGYWALPAHGKQQHGNTSIVEIYGGAPRKPLDVTVWVAD